MTERSKIEWCDATWPITTGCSPLSRGCVNCWAARLAATRLKHHEFYEGLAEIRNGHAEWTGKISRNRRLLDWPLHRRKSLRIFVAPTGDLFHESVPEDFLDRVFAVMALCPRHTFLLLTKRPERMRDYLLRLERQHRHPIYVQARKRGFLDLAQRIVWPLPNVWLGVSAEDQETADKRIPELLRTPAAVRYVSLEPLRGAVNLSAWLRGGNHAIDAHFLPGLRWVIVGGEAGRGARPMHSDWPRSLRDQCVAAGVPFFFKQWGEWEPFPNVFPHDFRSVNLGLAADAKTTIYMIRVGKKAAGRVLDGREWNEFPQSMTSGEGGL